MPRPDCGVREHVDVFAGRDVVGSALADGAKALEIGGRDRLLEPADVPGGEPVGPVERLPEVIGAVRVDEELGVADRLSRRVEPRRVALGLAADLHLHARETLVDPASELLGEPIVRVRREPAASVQRHRVTPGAEQLDERHPLSRALRSHSAMSTADMAIAPIPGRPALRSARLASVRQGLGVGSCQERRELLVDQSGHGLRAVGVAQAGLAARGDLHDDEVVESHSSVPSDSGSSVGIV